MSEPGGGDPGSCQVDRREAEPCLEVAVVSKSFGSTAALKDVSFSLERGEVLALIGENGAGKSTLMKILSGAVRPDFGSMRLQGKPFVPGSPLHARRAGVSMIYQELTLAPDLSVEENVLLGRESAWAGWIRPAEQRRRTCQALAQLEASGIDSRGRAGDLTLARQQLVEIARALAGDPAVLILDEPTSSLSAEDSQRLFDVIRQLRARGVAVIYISHFLEECEQVADRYLVLRDGLVVGEGAMGSAKRSEIVHLMVGREVKEIFPPRRRACGRKILRVEGLRGRRSPRDATFELSEGEILGVAGLVGSGRSETARVIFGLDGLRSGEVVLLDEKVRRPSPRKSLHRGMGMVSEDRKGEGLFLNRSVADNLTMTRFGPVARWGWIGRGRQDRAVEDWIGKLGIRTQGPDQETGELSGGNQQKVAVGRLLWHEARILILDEPARGIDVGSKAQIYAWMAKLAESGKAILFISSYLPELLGVCDRIAVMSKGRIRAVRPVEDWTEHAIMLEAIGEPAGTLEADD